MSQQPCWRADSVEVPCVDPCESCRSAVKRSITGDTALRLGHWFGIEPQFWVNLQTQHDLAIAAQEVSEAVDALPTARQIA